MFDSGLLTMPALADPAVSEVATFPVANLAVQAGDRLAFYGQGIPLDDATGTDAVFYPSPQSRCRTTSVTLPSAEFPAYVNPRTYSFAASVVGPDQVTVTGGIKKFVDELPRSIAAAVPDTTTYPGSDFYGSGSSSTPQKMHSDLPTPTKLRGYVQLNADGTDGNAELPRPGHRGAEGQAGPDRVPATCCRPARVATSSSRWTPR